MKWIKPHGLAVLSTILVDVDIPVKVESAVIEDIDIVKLDPGGMLYTKAPFHTISVNNYKFSFQRYKIDDILYKMGRATEPRPGIKLFTMYLANDIIMSNELFSDLTTAILASLDEDETIHESLDVALAKNELAEHPNILMNIKKETPEE